MILTQSQTNRINHMLPGECVLFDGYRLVCREVQPCVSATGCRQCAFHRIKCDDIKCLRGSIFTYTGPDGEVVEAVRASDQYYTLHL